MKPLSLGHLGMLSELPSEEGISDHGCRFAGYCQCSCSPFSPHSMKNPLILFTRVRQIWRQGKVTGRDLSRLSSVPWAPAIQPKPDGLAHRQEGAGWECVSTQNTRQFTWTRVFTQVHACALARSVHLASLH